MQIRYLESSTIWGFASWWCYRSSFYYPASSISQCQLSPIQAIEVMGEKMTPALMELEMRRTMISEQAVAHELDPLELLNERIAGLCLAYEDGYDKAKDGLSIVEDYVRSLGGPDDNDVFDYFQTADGGGPGSGAANSNNNRLSTAFLSARKNQPMSQHGARFAGPATGTASGTSEWVEFSKALEDDFEESTWFYMSLNLLAEICKDRNAYTQRIVGSILPAECLLSILEVSVVPDFCFFQFFSPRHSF